MTLVEQIVFIAVVAVAVAGVLAALNLASRSSAEPLVEKQALAIAEAFLAEAQLMPFTYCDPDDANAATATSAAGCAVTQEVTTTGVIGPEAGETRYHAVTPFDNVNDYHNYQSNLDAPPGIKDIAQNPISALTGYSVAVNVQEQALGAVPATESLLITVTVTGPGGTTVVLDGYRTRYAPNALP